MRKPVSKKLDILFLNPGSLSAHPQNPRKHSQRQIKQVAESIRKFGFRFPVLVDSKNRLVAGHCRKAAAELLGLDEIPVIQASDLNDAQIRALMIADNRLTEISDWDDQLLGENFRILADLNLDFDITITGFDYGDIERFLIIDEEGKTEPEMVDMSAVPAVTKPGDLWQLGEHKVLCGDSTQSSSYSVLLGDTKGAMVFTDPPYNLPAKTIGKVAEKRHGNFVKAAGEMTPEAFTRFLVTVFQNLCQFTVSGSIHYHFMDWRHLGEILDAGDECYSELKNICVWAKDRPGMGTFYRSQHEFVMVFKNGKSPHKNNFKLGQHGRMRSNIWNFPSVRSANEDAGDKKDKEALQLHPTIKPVRLIEEALLDCSRRKDIVLDPFLGSGSTLIACEKTQRQCYGIEFAPHYVDVILYRWSQFTGKEPVHTQSDMSYNARMAFINKKDMKPSSQIKRGRHGKR